jgi:hypothetical protein
MGRLRQPDREPVPTFMIERHGATVLGSTRVNSSDGPSNSIPKLQRVNEQGIGSCHRCRRGSMSK